MQTRRLNSFALLLLCLPMVAWAAPDAPSLHVSGAVGKPADWTAARLGKDLTGDVQTVYYKVKGVAHTAHAVPLLSVVQAAQPAYNPHIKNHRLQFVVAVQGFDGYTVDFSLAELLPEIGHRAVWLALDEDGKPLADDSGPVGLVVPDDTKPGRWVHGVRAITVIDGAQASAPGGGVQ
jgi:hypothetical protein